MDYRQGKFLHQAPIDFICVFDLKCTESSNCTEIIDFPVVLIDTRSKSIVSTFQTFVKPEIEP